MRRFVLALSAVALVSVPAFAQPRIDAVAAGDPTGTSAILWARAADAGRPVPVRLEIATDPAFAAIVHRATAPTVAEDDFTVKIPVDGLRPGTRYHYRFCAVVCDPADTGRFNTAPAPDQRARLRFGFTGDADGRYRPYPAAANIGDRDLDFFILLGDAMYEVAAKGSPATIRLTANATPADVEQGLADFLRKYRENSLGVTSDGTTTLTGQQGLRPMRQATGHYTMLDNHELGSADLQAGGAPPGARGFNLDPALDTNETGPFNNQTAAFRVMEKAVYAYHPTRTSIAGTPATGLRVAGPVVEQPSDPRMHGTPRNWFAQPWGAHAVYIQTDGRTYRDARLGAPSVTPWPNEETGPRADNPRRTMLGRTQMAWLKETLLAEQRAGRTWKFVGISSPIDQVGSGEPVLNSRWPAPGTQNQDGKSWFGGYRAERNELLGFIADNAITNVVFLTTDDHFVRVTTLQYQTQAGAMAPVPGAFQIVSGPIGAGGPDFFPGHDRAAVAQGLALRQARLAALNQPPTGLPADFPGLTLIHRRFGPQGGPPEPIDFFIPDQFAYSTLEVDPDGVLTVETFGINAYKTNIFPDSPMRAERVMSFRIAPR